METNEAAVRGTSPRPGSAAPREDLVFRLGAREYGIDILKVQEIRGYEQPTRIANAPSFVRGVVNLRGVIVPIVDLRLRFGLGPGEWDSSTAAIVANLGGRLTGLVVDAVCGVIEWPPDAVSDAGEIPGAVYPGCITGLGALGDRAVLLVDVERLVTALDLESAG